MRLELSKSSLQESGLKESNNKKSIIDAFIECRAKTLLLFKNLDEATFCCLAHPDFSPVGWHLGHIAYTESLWILERTAANSLRYWGNKQGKAAV
ncbi:MAG: DinB family protein, partial [Cyanobacteria bacterium J06641_2]